MNPSNGGKTPAKEIKESTLKAFLTKLRKRHIIETFAGFIAGGWLLLEFVHWLLVDHYHFPEKTIDITVVTLLCALICTLIWRWFGGIERAKKFRLEFVLIPLVLLITLLLDINLILHLKGPEPEAVPAAKWKNSIAVLPFVDMSPQKDQEYFCDGMTEELINRLSNIRELKVPARTSAFFFKGKPQDIQDIGQKLKVNTVLEGSVRKAGNELRITAQLINIADGYHLWSEKYDRELKDIFAIQDDIAQAIVRALQIRLLGEQEERAVRRYTENMEAHKAYWEGLYYWNRRTGKDLNKAIELFNRAIDKDPNYAMAYVGLADSFSLLSQYGDARPKDVFPRAKAAATKALEIDETLAEAHNSLAYVYERFDWNWKGAEAEFKRALELNPNYATAHFWYGELLTFSGRFEEAIGEIKQALELDPVSRIINAGLGWAYLYSQQPDQALPQLRRTLGMDPNFAYARMMLGFANLANTNFSAAIDEMKKARELSGDATYAVYSLGAVYAVAGKLKEVRGILEELKARSQKQYVPASSLAMLYGTLGDRDKAWELMNRAVEERDDNLISIKINPVLSEVHSDPRYKALLKKMGLE